MNIQMKREMLDMCILAVIKKQETYGYQIIKEIEPCMGISQSTLYPILRRLKAMKLLVVRSEIHNGRLRKYYSITDAGQNRLKSFAEDQKGKSTMDTDRKK